MAAVSTTGISKPIKSRVPLGSAASLRAATSALSRKTAFPQTRQIVRPIRAYRSLK